MYETLPIPRQRTTRGDRVGAGLNETFHEEATEEEILAYVKAQKDAGVPRNRIKLPCGQRMVVDRLDTFGEPEETFKPMFDHPEFEPEWEYSDQAKAQYPGIQSSVNYHNRPWIGRRGRR